MNHVDEEILVLKKRFYTKTLPRKLKEVRRKCEDSFGIPLSLGDRMLLKQSVEEMCAQFSASPLCGGDPSKEGLAKYLVHYHNLRNLSEFRRY